MEEKLEANIFSVFSESQNYYTHINIIEIVVFSKALVLNQSLLFRCIELNNVYTVRNVRLIIKI